MTIQARPVATLTQCNDSGFASDITVAMTTEPGTVTIPSATGDRPVAYDKDEVVISDQDGTTIAGPLGRDDAIILATAVLEGQRRAVTHPQLHLLLAGAVLAFASGTAIDRSPETTEPTS